MNHMPPGDFNQAGITFRSVQPEDGPGVVCFLNQVFGHWGSLEDWQWKYLSPPAPFRFESLLAEYQGQIVGHYGLLPLEAIWNGQIVPAAQAIDAGVLPEHRRGGVFTTLAKKVLSGAAHRGAIWIYAFPGLLSLNANRRMGFRPVTFVSEMMRVVNLPRALRLAGAALPGDLATLWRLRHPGYWTPEAVRRVVRLRRIVLLFASLVTAPHRMQQRRPPASHMIVSNARQFDDRLDGLWSRVIDSAGVGLCKDSRYLNWRYCNHPSRSYHILLAEDGDQLAGCLVLHHTGLRTEITELLVLPDRPDVEAHLLQAATAQAQNSGSVLLSIWAYAGQPSYPGLRQAGFVSPARLIKLAESWPALARQLYQVIIYPEHLSFEQQSILTRQMQSRSLSMGDSDLV